MEGFLRMASTRKPERKPENLKRMLLIELNEILEREQKLLRNGNLMNKLPDKGESIKKFFTQVEDEIKFRQSLDLIQDSMNKISISEQDKHVQKMCDLEKSPEKDRYKPFATLNKVKNVPPDSKIFKIMEDCNQSNKPTKLILLPESMDILKKQEERVKNEQVRIRFNRLMREAEDNDDSEKSASEQDSDIEEECT
ncbi:hypothetical protein JTB14_023826 [Gonioctena quinquepunctata]|nr:hypothetical protein JTB14_023826 [Gonioctena quinquepunctata]